MIQSGGILPDLLAAIPQIILLTIEEALKRGVKEAVTLAKNDAWELAKKNQNILFIKELMNLIKSLH